VNVGDGKTTTAKEVRGLFGACMKRAGVERKGSAWYIRSPEAVTVIDLQKSQYGPSYYCNVGFWMAVLGKAGDRYPTTPTAHIIARAETLFEADRHRIASLLNAASGMSIDDRTAGLRGLIEEQLLPVCRRAVSPAALFSMRQDGTLAGAGVRAPAHWLFEAMSRAGRAGGGAER
jgi:hypothetical protein